MRFAAKTENTTFSHLFDYLLGLYFHNMEVTKFATPI